MAKVRITFTATEVIEILCNAAFGSDYDIAEVAAFYGLETVFYATKPKDTAFSKNVDLFKPLVKGTKS